MEKRRASKSIRSRLGVAGLCLADFFGDAQALFAVCFRVMLTVSNCVKRLDLMAKSKPISLVRSNQITHLHASKDAAAARFPILWPKAKGLSFLRYI
ncbi:hypothetical protein BDW68DRAFT_4620 [Aspergillus falconensis]